MKKTYEYYVFLLILSACNFSVNSYIRDPFCYGDKYKCIAIGRFDKEHYFAVIFYQNKNHIVKKGDTFFGFKVAIITDNSIELIKCNGDKKALQLR